MNACRQMTVIESSVMNRLSLVLLFAICAFGQKIDVEFDESADFTKYKTFAIRDGQLHSKNPTLNSELVKKRIEADTSNLTAKGLSQVSSPADLNVRYTLGSARKREVETYPAGWRGWGTRRVVVPYSEGTLVIDLRETSTRSLVWRAVAVEHKSDPYKLEGKLEDMVKKSFEKYPPKKK